MSTIGPDRAASVADSERIDSFALKRVEHNYVTIVDLKAMKRKKVKAFDVKSSLSTLSIPRNRIRKIKPMKLNGDEF